MGWLGGMGFELLQNWKITGKLEVEAPFREGDTSSSPSGW